MYAGLEILTSQPESDLTTRVPHHLIGHLPVTQRFDAAQWVQAAQEAIRDVQSRGHRPILVGGTGLYLKALTHGLDEIPPTPPEVRAELSALSPTEVLARLDQADPTAREEIDVHNPRRVQRALEIFLTTGRSARDLRQGWKRRETPGFEGMILVRERNELHDRIAQTVDRMFARGVVEEVRQLPETISETAAMAIGLREIQSLLRGEMTEAQCREAMVQATRRYAKRQLTWFRNQFSFPHIDLTVSQNTSQSHFPARQAPGSDA